MKSCLEWMKCVGCLGSLAACLGLLGCASNGGDGASAKGKEQVDELHLMAMPLALNLDQIPGGDGFAIKVYAGCRARPKPIPISEGNLEIVIYDGTQAGGTNVPPLRVWSFSPAELKAHALTGLVGTGYAFTLKWEEAVPKRRKITVLARYRLPDGRGIQSAPSSIAVAD